MNLMEEMFFKGFPREMGEHRWIAKSKEEAVNWIVRNRGFVSSYISIYSFNQFNMQKNDRPIYESANVDKVYFDLDSSKCREDMIKLHEYYLKENIRHLILLSGNGYHVYAFCKPITNTDVDFSVSEALANYQNYIGEIVGIEICTSCRGNLSKVSRIPNTWHPHAKRFCIPISNPYADNISLASQQQWDFKVFGSNLIDLTLWKPKPVSDPVDIPLLDVNGIEFPPCMVKILKNENPGFSERMALVSYLNEMFRLGADNISTDDIIRITDQIVDFLETLKWKRFSRSKSKKYIRYLVKGLSKSFSHQKIRNLGLCEHCEKEK